MRYRRQFWQPDEKVDGREKLPQKVRRSPRDLLQTLMCLSCCINYKQVYASLKDIAGFYNNHYPQANVDDNLERRFKGRKGEETGKNSMGLAIFTLPLTSSVSSVSCIKN